MPPVFNDIRCTILLILPALLDRNIFFKGKPEKLADFKRECGDEVVICAFRDVAGDVGFDKDYTEIQSELLRA